MRVAARGGGVVRTRRVGHNRGSDFLRKAAMQHTCAEAWAGHVPYICRGEVARWESSVPQSPEC
jgi:hypothetical protein